MRTIYKILFNIYTNDKTPEYSYNKENKNYVNTYGIGPGGGSRWKTPREIIRDYLGSKFWLLYNKYKLKRERKENK